MTNTARLALSGLGLASAMMLSSCQMEEVKPIETGLKVLTSSIMQTEGTTATTEQGSTEKHSDDFRTGYREGFTQGYNKGFEDGAAKSSGRTTLAPAVATVEAAPMNPYHNGPEKSIAASGGETRPAPVIKPIRTVRHPIEPYQTIKSNQPIEPTEVYRKNIASWGDPGADFASRSQDDGDDSEDAASSKRSTSSPSRSSGSRTRSSSRSSGSCRT